MITARRENTRTTFENIYVANESLREYQSLRRHESLHAGEFICMYLYANISNIREYFLKNEKKHSFA